MVYISTTTTLSCNAPGCTSQTTFSEVAMNEASHELITFDYLQDKAFGKGWGLTPKGDARCPQHVED